ncbi:MAG: hypothetical protein JEZ06_14915 [Anaerolineaceae bacterium]|nr:hypothetical protein [Anaerolineaceae bacterium]
MKKLIHNNSSIHGLIIQLGGVLIFLSGVISIGVGVAFGLWYYEVDPNGWFGHVGIFPGLGAVGIGIFLYWLGRRDFLNIRGKLLAGILSMVFGHLGAVFGAMIIGTLGVLFCYTGGIGYLTQAFRQRKQFTEE